ncbi:MAG: UbiA-like protein EboC [Balneolaceae bacterium]|nr:UbiA-like protein EboC [Balneolaceae bacterium]
MLTKIRASLELIRPANIITAFADILAGYAVAGGTIFFVNGLESTPEGLLLLLIATFGLYGGGVVFNDVFDAELDANERPERAIPSGRITITEASLLGGVLLLIGVLSAFQVNIVSGVISVVIAACAIFYDWKAKHSVLWGPFFMGMCRGGNLLLGMSVAVSAIMVFWPLAIIPVIYIAAITLVSQSEVSGGNRQHGFIALGVMLVVITALVLLSVLPETDFLPSLPFLLIFAIMVLPAFYSAAKTPEPSTIKSAIKRGVISLVLLNSVIAAAFAGFIMGVIVFGVFLLSVLTAKIFDVT